jgi:hypothetical protein
LHRRLRVVAFLVIGLATALMWSDTAIQWWSDIVAFALRVNENATSSVMDNRPSGDADAHAVIWGASASLLAFSFTKFRHRMISLAALLGWTIAVEFGQPLFTELRSRQLTDLVGNALGVGFIVAVVFVQQARNRRSTE